MIIKSATNVFRGIFIRLFLHHTPQISNVIDPKSSQLRTLEWLYSKFSILLPTTRKYYKNQGEKH